MCRDRDHGGRRCPEDNSQARRNRRQNAKKKNEHENNVSKPIEPQNITIPVIDDNPAVKAREILSEYKEIASQNFMPKNDKDHFHHKHPLTDNEILAEQKLIELGNAVEELAAKYNAPTEDEWQQMEIAQETAESNMLMNRINGYNKLMEMTGARLLPRGGNKPPGLRIVFFQHKLGYEHSEYEVDYYLMKAGEYIESGDIEKAKEISDTLSALSEESKEYENLKKSSMEDMVNRRSEAYRKALEEIGVEFAGTDDLNFSANRNKEGNQLISKASTYYPKAWVDNSNNITGFKLSVTQKDRSYYSSGANEMKINLNRGLPVATHEIAHRLEHTNPEIGNAERLFMSRRSGLLAYHKGETQTYRSPVNGKEPAYADNFAVDYVGRVYDATHRYSPDYGQVKGTSSYEVLSMGMESVFHGGYGAGVGLGDHRRDPETNKFILGLLATTAK